MATDAAIAVIRDGSVWIVVISENGRIAESSFNNEQSALSWANNERLRRGLKSKRLKHASVVGVDE